MSLSEEVQSICQSSDESLIIRKAGEWASKPESACKEIISRIKKVIKAKKEHPTAKLRALKLHHRCMLNANFHYLQFSEKKIMRRLAILAAFERGRKDVERGAYIFGSQYSNNESTRQVCIEFHQTLLVCIREWATRFGTGPSGNHSEFLKVYLQLKNEVMFPSPPVAVLPPASPRNSMSRALPRVDLPPAELDEAETSEQLMRELLISPKENEDMLVQLSDTLRKFVAKVEHAFNAPNQLNDRTRDRILKSNEAAVGTLRKYEDWKSRDKKRPQPIRVEDAEVERAIRESLKPSPAKASMNPSREKSETLRKLEMELAELKKELAEFDATHEEMEMQRLHEETEGDRKVAEVTRKLSEELQAKKAKVKTGAESKAVRAKLEALQSELTVIQTEVKEKEETLRIVLKAIGAAQEESRRLQELLREAEEVRSPRVSATNVFLWPRILESDKGMLFSDAEVEIGYWVTTQSEMRVYIGNKTDQKLEELTCIPLSCPALTLQINKEREEASLEPRVRAMRLITFAASEPFSDIPRLRVSYRRAQNSKQLELLLPIHVVRFIIPTDSQSAIASLWDSLADSEEQTSSPPSMKWFSRFMQQATVGAFTVLCGSFRDEVVCIGFRDNSVLCRCKAPALRAAVVRTLNCAVVR